MNMHWYTIGDIEKEEDKASLVAMGLEMWGNCHLQRPPEYFGKAMVLLGEKLGISPTQEEITKLADEILANIDWRKK
jgi:hypothetical protein